MGWAADQNLLSSLFCTIIPFDQAAFLVAQPSIGQMAISLALLYFDQMAIQSIPPLRAGAAPGVQCTRSSTPEDTSVPRLRMYFSAIPKLL